MPNQIKSISLRYQNDITLKTTIMETKEYQFNGTVLNGFLMLFVNLAVLALSIYGVVCSIIMLNDYNTGG